MSALSVIERILGDVGKGIAIFTGVEPMVYPSLPLSAQSTLQQVTDDLTNIGKAVTSATAVTAAIKPGATVQDIAAAAAPLVAQVISTSELIAGKEVIDQVAFNAAVLQISAGITALLNSLKHKS